MHSHSRSGWAQVGGTDGIQEVKVGAERQLPSLGCSCDLVTQTLCLLLFTPLLAEPEALNQAYLSTQ